MVEATEITITTDRSKIIAFYILQRQAEVVNEIQEFESMRFLNSKAVRSHTLKASIIGLWFQVRSNIRYSDEKLYDKIEAFMIRDAKLDDYLSAFYEIDKFLCDANLSRFIFKRDYDMSSPVEEDEAKGL